MTITFPLLQLIIIDSVQVVSIECYTVSYHYLHDIDIDHPNALLIGNLYELFMYDPNYMFPLIFNILPIMFLSIFNILSIVFLAIFSILPIIFRHSCCLLFTIISDVYYLLLFLFFIIYYCFCCLLFT